MVKSILEMGAGLRLLAALVIALAAWLCVLWSVS